MQSLWKDASHGQVWLKPAGERPVLPHISLEGNEAGPGQAILRSRMPSERINEIRLLLVCELNELQFVSGVFETSRTEQQWCSLYTELRLPHFEDLL